MRVNQQLATPTPYAHELLSKTIRTNQLRYSSRPRTPRLRNDLYCVEWDVKLYYTVPALALVRR